MTLTSDYVYRGVSQSLEDPAVQGSFSFELEAGLLVGLWASSVQFPTSSTRDSPRDLELDYLVGYRFDLGRDWTADLVATHYTYPGSDSAFDYDYSELRLALGLGSTFGVAIAYSDDAFGHGEASLAYEVLSQWPVGRQLDVVAGVGYYDLERVFGDSYTYWNVDLARAFGRFTLALGYIDTGTSGGDIWGDELSGARFVASLTASIQ